MATYDNKKYVLKKMAGGRVRVTPKNGDLKTFSVGIAGSMFLIDVEDIKSATEPLWLREIISDDTGLRGGYHFGSGVEKYTFGDMRVVEEYSGSEQVASPSGVPYTKLTGYKKYSSNGFNIVGANVLPAVIARLNGFGGSYGDDQTLIPMGVEEVEEPFIYSNLYQSHNGVVFFLDVEGVFRKFETKNMGSFKAKGEDADAFITALQNAVDNFISSNNLNDGEGNPAKVVEISEITSSKIGYGSRYKFSEFHFRFNNGKVARVNTENLDEMYLTSAARAVRLDGGTIIQASAQFMAGSNGELAYGTPSKSVDDMGLTKAVGVRFKFGGTVYLGGGIAGKGESGTVPCHWYNSQQVFPSGHFDWVSEHIDGYVEHMINDTRCSNGTFLGRFATNEYRYATPLSISNGVVVEEVENTFLSVDAQGAKILDALQASKIPSTVNTSVALLETKANTETEKKFITQFFVTQGVGKGFMVSDTELGAGFIASIEHYVKHNS